MGVMSREKWVKVQKKVVAKQRLRKKVEFFYIFIKSRHSCGKSEGPSTLRVTNLCANV